MKRLCLLVYLIGMLLITGTGKGHTQMDTKSLISLLNFSKTLIQDGEIKYLLYEKFFVHPDEAGDGHRKTLAFREQELKDAHKARDPESFRKAVLENIEKEKKFGWYGDADEHYPFLECDLVFRVHPESMEHDSRFDYRLYTASQFENYPSVKYARFFGWENQWLHMANFTQAFRVIFPKPYDNRRIRSSVHQGKYHDHTPVIDVSRVPPTNSIDDTQAEVKQIKSEEGKSVTVITHFPHENVKVLVYIRVVSGLLQVFREEYYYLNESPLADEDGYWLRVATDYSDFEEVKSLNLSFPKVRDTREYRSVDRFVRRRTVLTIKEMDFNLGFPANFFDWDEAELTYDDGRRRHIFRENQEENNQENQKETIK